MIVSNITELFLYPVEDRGIPNKERIPILVQERVEMGYYGIMVGQFSDHQGTQPFLDNLFWFGRGIANAGDWILVYSGGGINKSEDWSTPPGSKVYSAHWCREKTMFANSATVPILFRFDKATIGKSLVDLPQNNYLIHGS